MKNFSQNIIYISIFGDLLRRVLGTKRANNSCRYYAQRIFLLSKYTHGKSLPVGDCLFL